MRNRFLVFFGPNSVVFAPPAFFVARFPSFPAPRCTFPATDAAHPRPETASECQEGRKQGFHRTTSSENMCLQVACFVVMPDT